MKYTNHYFLGFDDPPPPPPPSCRQNILFVSLHILFNDSVKEKTTYSLLGQSSICGQTASNKAEMTASVMSCQFIASRYLTEWDADYVSVADVFYNNGTNVTCYCQGVVCSTKANSGNKAHDKRQTVCLCRGEHLEKFEA